MRVIRCKRFLRMCSTLAALLSFSIWSTASVVPLSAQAAALPLGLAAGAKEAQITLDGKHWATLASSSSPIYDGTTIRTGNGIASALLKDGTQLEVQPRSVIEISGSRTAPVVKIALGRVLFRLPASSTTVLVTPGVRYHSPTTVAAKSPTVTRVGGVNPHSSDQVGEIFVTGRGGSRIGLRQGEMQAKPVNDPGLIVKTGQSVYIPLVDAGDPSLKALLTQALPEEAASRPASAIPLYDQEAGFGFVLSGLALAGGVAGAVIISNKEGANPDPGATASQFTP